ncbi:hypothetical protein IJ732_02320 [bacterium]|nr:hypothetical protein [bacterium]
MGIGIETNLYLICSAFQIDYAKLNKEYSGMTINQIMAEEAAQGNDLASKFDEELLSDPKKLIDFIQLNNPSNKFAILSNMNETDLDEMLPLLDTQDLVMGLNYFNQSALLQMVAMLPGEQAANLTLQMFSPEHLMSLMPKEALDELLERTEIKEMKDVEEKCALNLPPEIMAQMIEAVTGDVPAGIKGIDLGGNVSFDIDALRKQIKGFNQDEFQDSLLAIPPAHKQGFVLEMTKEKPEVWSMFNPIYFAGVIADKKQKDDIIKASAVLEPETLVQMNQQLPQELLAAVLTQIDTKEFAEILQKNFKDVLGELALS